MVALFFEHHQKRKFILLEQHQDKELVSKERLSDLGGISKTSLLVRQSE